MEKAARNFTVIVVASIFFGASGGIYDLIFPYYLDKLGIGFATMGITFSIASLVIAVSSVYIAGASDLWGRKYFYSLGMGLGAISSAMLPVLNSVPFLIVSKTLKEASLRFRQAIHGTLIYEFAPARFADLYAKSRGIEYLSEAGGQFSAGALLVILGFTNSFFLCACLLAAAIAVFLPGFVEDRAEKGVETPSLGLRETFSPDLPRNLALIAISSFIFAVGLSTSHNFIMPLFFSKKFGATVGQVSVILGLHRLSIALPLLISGMAVRFSWKKTYIVAIVYEGLSLTASGLLPNLYASAGVWLTHDLLGAAIWMPVQASLIQRFARQRTRGRDVSKVRALGFLGWIFGPLIAGWASPISISLPFILSGVIVTVSILPILALHEPDDSGRKLEEHEVRLR